ncbi:pectate lyase-like adhesive domain-containing protein [Holzapfeliella sp. JNUCC 72]
MGKQTKNKNYKKLAGAVSVALCSVALTTGFLAHTGVNTGQTVLADDQSTDNSVKNVSTAQQLYEALSNQDVKTINIQNDIDMSSYGSSSSTEHRQSGAVENKNLTINGKKSDGGKFSVNFGNWNFDYKGNSNITLNDISLRGDNYFGPVSLSDYSVGNITYNNVDYTGSQLTYANSGTVKFAGTVKVNSNSSVNSGQENLEAKNIEFLDGSMYVGQGSSSLFNIHNSGKITLDGAIVNLSPNPGNAVAPIIGADSNGIDIKNNSNLNITAQWTLNLSYPIVMDNSNLNITAPDNTTFLPLLKVSKPIKVNNGSKLNVTGQPFQNSQLVANGDNISLSGNDSKISVKTQSQNFSGKLMGDLNSFPDANYTWSMLDKSGTQLSGSSNYNSSITDLTITPKQKSVTVSSDNLSLSKEGNSFNINFDLDAQNVSPEDTTSVSVMINGNAHSSQTVPANQGNNRLSLGDGYTPKVNDQITVVSDFGLEKSSQTYTVKRDDVRSFYKPTLSINNDLTLSRSGDTISTGFVLNTENTDDQDKADNVTVSVQKHNQNTPNQQQDKLEQTSKLNQDLSLKLDANYTPEVGDVITVSAALDGVNGSTFTKAKKLTQADVDALKKLEGSTPSFQSGLVNYVKGYGVLVWQLTANGLEPTTQYQAANSYVPYYGDYQIVDGIKYLHIANQNTWIQAQYLQDPTQLPEIPMNNTAVAGNVPYGIYLRDGSGNMTEQIIEPGTSWQVFAKKTFHGHTYYRLGNDQQWLEDTYIQSMN